ncbi:hypothetical protein BDS110ZK17_83540 [Bradyrhizobium diazoefficiens]
MDHLAARLACFAKLDDLRCHRVASFLCEFATCGRKQRFAIGNEALWNSPGPAIPAPPKGTAGMTEQDLA